MATVANSDLVRNTTTTEALDPMKSKKCIDPPVFAVNAMKTRSASKHDNCDDQTSRTVENEKLSRRIAAKTPSLAENCNKTMANVTSGKFVRNPSIAPATDQ